MNDAFLMGVETLSTRQVKWHCVRNALKVKSKLLLIRDLNQDSENKMCAILL